MPPMWVLESPEGNDRRIATARLKSGDRLRIGRVELTVGQKN